MKKNWIKTIDLEIKLTDQIPHSYKPVEAVIKVLRNKTIYLQTGLETNSGGSPRAREIGEFGRVETALSRDNGWKGDGRYVNSETIPYIALPGKFNLVSGIGCKLGDLVFARSDDAEVFAIYADVGPIGHIGEGSIALVESLGANPWNRSKTKIVSGIDSAVELLIFPRSSEKFGIPQTFDEIQAIGQTVFDSFFCETRERESLSMTVSKHL